ncbi:guanine nucleotide-releasing factor 2 isoform X5 [Cloeon dipterum]|uniref:guanine nucleotide-releasing factor 2 isoform X5 n=1 Tax=Cloeon dipterum TaxID=197152 RepID=UPI00321FD9B9
MPWFDESLLDASEAELTSFCPQKPLPPLPRGKHPVSCYALRRRSERWGIKDAEPGGGSPPLASNKGGGKSQRGGKLARRARSFKEDFLDKLSNIRSNPRSQSPHSPKMSSKAATNGGELDAEPANPHRELDQLVKQVHLALKHLRDVVSKNKLEMLPGNGTIVLEIVTNIVANLRNYFIGEQSSSLVSATSHLHQCLARLIRLCDDVVLYGSQALGRENINQLVQSVQDAVQSLVSLAREKLAAHKTNSIVHTKYKNGVHLEANGRASLPDIPLTPRERQILAQTPQGGKMLGHSMSSESILEGHEGPPPKPPLPNRNPGDSPSHLPTGRSRSTAPPLPPKRRNRSAHTANNASTHSLSPPCTPAPPPAGSLELASSAERLSISPAHSAGGNGEDSCSLLSASNAGSMDSVNNQLHISDDYDDDSFYVRSNGNISPNYWGSSSSRRASIDSPSSFFNSHDLREPPPTTLATPSNGHISRILLNYNEDVPDFKNSIASSSSSYVSQQSCSSTSVSFSSETTSFASHSMSSSKRTVVTSELSSSTSDYSSQQSNFSVLSNGTGSPPALPQKTKIRTPRLPSQYDNVGSTLTNLNQMLLSNPNRGSCLNNDCISPSDRIPPPLPPKMRHIKAYMEMFGKYSSPSTAWSESVTLRHSMHTYSALQAEWARSQAETMTMSSTHSCMFSSSSSYSFTHWAPLERSDNKPNLAAASPVDSPPPALPPKMRSGGGGVNNNGHRLSISPPPATTCLALPTLAVPAAPASPLTPLTPVTPTPTVQPPPPPIVQASTAMHEPPIYDFGRELPPPPPRPTSIAPLPKTTVQVASPDLTPQADPSRSSTFPNDGMTTEVEEEEGPLDETDVTAWLVFKKPEEEGPEIRGGHLDALIVHATKANKNDEDETDFLYQEAFLTTYRTFMSPLELITKLQRRYRKFAQPVNDNARQRAARNSFSLLVRVVSDLTINDLETDLLKILNDLIFTLVECGDLNLARALRGKVLEKCDAKRFCNTTPNAYLTSLSMQSRMCSLLDFKSEQLAEQMTLLDAELFMKIEIPEVLLWAQEQNEERSPNLTEFTEHFNKMSYWARSRILEQKDAKDRERYVVKFIKVMRHLRKVNNFNSYLALLSALDSAPIRRLEWHRQITEGLKEYCALIDSSSSFRAYRQALAETQPPCIPYIGLVLQDLTFVNIGNSNALPDGAINFSKRWQQFNIVENMKRFKKCQYHFKKQERILALFNNFDDFLCEESMWQISETIKPRGQNSAKK